MLLPLQGHYSYYCTFWFSIWLCQEMCRTADGYCCVHEVSLGKTDLREGDMCSWRDLAWMWVILPMECWDLRKLKEGSVHMHESSIFFSCLWPLPLLPRVLVDLQHLTSWLRYLASCIDSVPNMPSLFWIHESIVRYSQ